MLFCTKRLFWPAAKGIRVGGKIIPNVLLPIKESTLVEKIELLKKYGMEDNEIDHK